MMEYAYASAANALTRQIDKASSDNTESAANGNALTTQIEW